jgi:hypothetical protein
MMTNNELDSRTFLLEVVIFAQSSVQKCQAIGQRRSKFFLKVPYKRMSQEIRRIHRLGGKILNVTQTSGLNGNPQSLSWWIEIYTDFPRCFYYFGPFESETEAQAHQGGYLDDLRQEGAENILVEIKQCRPLALTQEW